MGGSLALALKGQCAAIYGIDPDQATLSLALDRQIVDQADSNPATLLPLADLIILAAPVPAILNFIRTLGSLIQTSCIVFDLGSTKREIVQALAGLPEWFDPIGGHPICGKEKLGLENADPNLYQDAPFVITDLHRTTRQAKSAVQQIISSIGAHAIPMTAEDHDRALAFTSHLPFLLSSGLALSTPSHYSPLIGTGFKSTSRLAGTPSHMTMGILQSNRDNILGAIQIFHQSLEEIESALHKENYRELERLLNQARLAYQSFIPNS